MGCVYCAVNLINGKMYIGISRHCTPIVRWRSHVQGAKREGKTALCRAIRKHGEEAFAVEVIDLAESWDALCSLERFCIRYLKTKTPKGYNLTDGGEGFVGLYRTRAHRAKIAKALKGKKHKGFTKESRAKISKSLIGNKRRLGILHSEKSKAKIARSLVGNTNGRGLLGCKRSPRTREKMSKSASQR